jgi:hypothetical protein
LFKGLFEGGMKKIQQACEVYVKALDADKNAKKDFIEALPSIPLSAWVKFELVGRKQMIPELLTDTSPMAEKLKRMPLTVQTQVYGKNIPMVTQTGDILKVDFHGATQSQAKQIFSKNHVRTPEEQRAWIESRRSQATPAKMRACKSFEVRNGKLYVFQKCSFTLNELIQILGEL